MPSECESDFATLTAGNDDREHAVQIKRVVARTS